MPFFHHALDQDPLLNYFFNFQYFSVISQLVLFEPGASVHTVSAPHI